MIGRGKQAFTRDLAAWLLVGGLYLGITLPNLGSYALWDPWEPHYSQVVQEMNQRGTWLEPHYRRSNHWWSKPILTFWLLKASTKVLGQNELACRLPIVLCGLAGVLWTFWFMRRLFGLKAAFLSGLVLSTSPFYFMLSRQVMVDIPFVATLLGAMGCLALFLFTPLTPRRRLWALGGFYAFCGLGMLTKGLLAMVLPLGAVGAYVLVTWNWALLSRLRILPGLILFVAVASPWFLYMYLRFGRAFLVEFFIYHHLDRMSGTIDKPNDTFDLYIRQLAFGLFPWSAFVPAALAGLGGRAQAPRAEGLGGPWWRALLGLSPEPPKPPGGNPPLFLALWALVPFLLFSLSATKFNHYILPVVPFMAMAVALYLASLMEDHQAPLSRRMGLCLALAILLILAKDLYGTYHPLVQLHLYYLDRPLPPEVSPFTFFGLVSLAMALVLCLILPRARLSWPLLGAFGALTLAFALHINVSLIPSLADTYSLRMLHGTYQRVGPEGSPVCQYGTWLERSVSYYFDNRVRLIREPAGAVSFFRQHANRRAFCLVDRPAFNQLNEAVRQGLGSPLHIVDHGHRFTYLVSNRPNDHDQVTLKHHILQEPPEPLPFKVTANFGNKIQLLGYDVDRQEVRPGESFTVTYYFRCLERLDRDYQVFIHGDGTRGVAYRLHGDHTPVKGLYPTSQWEPGQIVRDEVKLTLDPKFYYDTMVLWIGFYDGPERLPVVGQAPSDGDNRVRTARIKLNR